MWRWQQYWRHQCENHQRNADCLSRFVRLPVPGPIPYQPYYLDPNPDSKHNGETRGARVAEFFIRIVKKWPDQVKGTGFERLVIITVETLDKPGFASTENIPMK